jgi:hypothetical protein
VDVRLFLFHVYVTRGRVSTAALTVTNGPPTSVPRPPSRLTLNGCTSSRFRVPFPFPIYFVAGSTDTWAGRWQIFSDSGPVITQTAKAGNVAVLFQSPRIRKKGTCSKSIPLQNFVGQTYNHELDITYGPNGKVSRRVAGSSSWRMSVFDPLTAIRSTM